MEKPKVRFSYNSENTAELEISKKENNIEERGKIKVKSIVPINLPIKVLKNGKRLLLKNQKKTNEVQVITEREINRKFSSQYASDRIDSFAQEKNCKLINSKPLVMSRTETSISETPINYKHLTNGEVNRSNKNYFEVQNCTDKLQEVIISETDKEFSNQRHHKILNPNGDISVEKNIPYIYLDDSENNENIKEVEIVNNFNTCEVQEGNKTKDTSDFCLSDVTLALPHTDKENDNEYSNLCKPFHEMKSTAIDDILKDTTYALSNKNRNKSIKKTVKVQKKLQVMPCAKFKSVPSAYNKDLNKQVMKQIKTRSTFNITGKASNIVVQPEMSNTLYNKYSNCHLSQSCKNKDVASKNVLSCPEYNSAICVMKKLKEIKGEKVIKNVESLPAIYKSIINGKVSTALDFCPYESVYKNLINLSIDDDELPTRLTRTKDPEPRNKDIIPNLSKFYNPKSIQEHFILVNPKIFNPISVNTLNAFTISNKICTWRISRDIF